MVCVAKSGKPWNRYHGGQVDVGVQKHEVKQLLEQLLEPQLPGQHDGPQFGWPVFREG